MNKKELIEISDKMFYTISHYVIHRDFTLEVYDTTNDKLNKRLVMNGEYLEIMNNLISYLSKKIITQINVRSYDKTIKVFVRERVK